MSQCLMAVTAGGKTLIAETHYAQGVLDHRKYHQQRAQSWRDDPGPVAGPEYAEEMIAFHVAAAKAEGRDRNLNIGGCEREAARHGCWVCDTPEAEKRFLRMIRRHAVEGQRLADCPLRLDFGTKTATIDPDNGLCDWESFLPDGWQAVFVEGC